MSHPPGYHGNERDDLLACLPSSAAGRRVLELGCGEGRLGNKLRERGHEVHGVEYSPTAAAVAATRLDKVHCGDAEQVPLDYPPGHFGVLLCGDVLEHLRDPWGLLTRLRPLLAADGILVASVPNVQYFPVVLSLLRGRFEYRDDGVLDRTHLRFFTLRSARALVEQAGFEITAMPVVYPFRTAWLRGVARVLDTLSLGLLRGFLLGQIRLVARPRAGG
jgi:2-polyprenyl-3-methyl-5-hydroxy-6-metoxy-1,4-benzoquinol methylase